MRAESFYNFATYIEEVSDMRAYGGAVSATRSAKLERELEGIRSALQRLAHRPASEPDILSAARPPGAAILGVMAHLESKDQL